MITNIYEGMYCFMDYSVNNLWTFFCVVWSVGTKDTKDICAAICRVYVGEGFLSIQTVERNWSGGFLTSGASCMLWIFILLTVH